MQPLVDADILLYECGYGAQPKETGVQPFEKAAELLDMKVAQICAVVEATQPPIMYLTGKGNFRYEIATRRQYKEGRGAKPFHYYNLKAYIKGKYEYVETVGMEADDALGIEQTKRADTIICSRDKDVRAISKWHYGWECYNQPSFGPEYVSELGGIRLSLDRKSIKGEGLLFFYAQCLVGDSTDTIPGLPRFGAVKAFEILDGCPSINEAFKRVLEAYRGVYGDGAERELLEQGRLLHMTRYLDEWGNPILWEFPIE